MKVIEFIIKIANNTLEDTCFKYDGNYFKYWKSNRQIDRYTDSTYQTVEYYNDELFNDDDLDKEIEIIEEDKEIEELDIIVNDEKTGNAYILNENGTKCFLTKHSKIIANKLNEVIKELNNIKKEGNQEWK